MSQHTPGPWVVSGKIGFQIAIASVAMEGLRLNVAHAAGIRNGEGSANARLIAAAPDLLAALETAKVLLESSYLDHEGTPSGQAIFTGLEAARAAIHKATGEA